MEQEGITENELRRTLPHASEETIQKNIGNKNWLRRSVAGSKLMGDAYENLQRSIPLFEKDKIVVKEGKTIVVYPKQEPVIPANARQGRWFEIGGKRIYTRSTWEAQYCAYLEFLKVNGYIREYQYESRTFWFEKIKRGVRSYKPDFLVIHNDGSEEWREVKGWLDPKSKTKLKRMKKYFPGVKVRVIDGAWFKKNGNTMAQIIPGWTKKKVDRQS